MKNRFLLFIILAVIFASCASFAESERFDVAGTWLLKGVGHVDKSFVRSQLSLSGHADLQTSEGEYVQMLESYDIYLRIDATGLNIKVYDEHITNGIKMSAPVPTTIPTEQYPIELPTVTHDGLTYAATITGSNSGVLTIQGVIRDVDIIGDVEIDSDCKIWKAGTPEPEIDTSKSSGCNAGFGIIMMLSMVFMGGVFKRVRD